MPLSTKIASLVLVASSALAPALAAECSHSAPRSLDLDLRGVKTVMFEVGPHELRVDATPAATGALSGRACASSADRLDALTLTQQREGDRLRVRLAHGEAGWSLGLGRRYAYLSLQASVPDDVLVQLDVGSGDAWLTGAAAASADVGSGDVELRRIRGLATVKVGSGDVAVDDAGRLKVLSIGSGDVEARDVRGDSEVGSIGSGDFSLRRAAGSVSIESIGSGDADLADIEGDVRIGSIGSGDVDAQGVGGGLSVSSVGSGDIDHSGVRGAVELPRRR
ncbi:hypothetical protein [Luteimonas sp. SDU82]|uniref:hypothetical protein n=1 Tax=Luteimonas sp. SDU82 TaxID=3422592 RepID=UPI003EBDE864